MIIGTAGHIDHGKTSLVKALTGMDADRLKEEKARGITIDLGFAYAPLPNGDVLGFVDVPGHERLVHNMLAGATGIDFVLLVVAADDGPMTQTREHLAILDLLGLSRGAVALTKIDCVPPDRIGAAIGEIESLLSGTGLADSRVFPLSSVSGQGVPELRAYLVSSAIELPVRPASGYFRMAVDRSFTLSGAGTVVTGTACSGEVHVGDRLLVSPDGTEVRVRNIYVQNRKSDTGRAGQRCALNLAGQQFEKSDVRRGDWLVETPIHAPGQRVDAHFKLLDSEGKPLKHWTPVHLHVGASDVTARVAVLEGAVIEPGCAAFIQIVADKPLCVMNGDCYVLRDQSATRTLGGGRVLDPFPPARNRRTAGRIAELRTMQERNHGAALSRTIEDSSMGVDLHRFFQGRNVRREEAQALWQSLPMYVVATPSTTVGFVPARWTELKQTVLNRLAAEHQQAPDSLGPDRARLHRMTLPVLARSVFFVLLDELISTGQITQSGQWLHLPGHRVTLTRAEEELWRRIQPLLQDAPFEPPRVRSIAQALFLPEASVRVLLQRVVRAGEAYLVAHDHYFAKDAVGELSAIVRNLAETHGSVRAAQFRDQIGTGRKLAIQLLEFFDRIGYTRRTGDSHRLREIDSMH